MRNIKIRPSLKMFMSDWMYNFTVLFYNYFSCIDSITGSIILFFLNFNWEPSGIKFILMVKRYVFESVGMMLVSIAFLERLANTNNSFDIILHYHFPECFCCISLRSLGSYHEPEWALSLRVCIFLLESCLDVVSIDIGIFIHIFNSLGVILDVVGYLLEAIFIECYCSLLNGHYVGINVQVSTFFNYAGFTLIGKSVYNIKFLVDLVVF